MPIEHSKYGATTITGDSLQYARMVSLKWAVALEMKGIKIYRGRVVWKQVKAEFNIKGGKKQVHAWLVAKVDELAKVQEHIVDGRKFVDGNEVS